MKQATIEYETEMGGKRVAILPSVDIAGDDPMIVLGGVIIALSDRISALEKAMTPKIADAEVLEPHEHQYEMDI